MPEIIIGGEYEPGSCRKVKKGTFVYQIQAKGTKWDKTKSDFTVRILEEGEEASSSHATEETIRPVGPGVQG